MIMSNDKHYNPAIYARLQNLAAEHDWQGIFLYLSTLSNAHFRTAGYILGERVFPSLPETDAWAMTTALVSYDAKAFLGTMLKAVNKGFIDCKFHLHSNGAKTFLNSILSRPVDVQKTLLGLLPVMEKPEDILWLFRKLEVEEGEPRIPYLIRTHTMAAGYVLFRTTKYVEHDRVLLVRVVRFLMKQGDGFPFNLASLFKTYYGLDEVKGTFSLRIEPYQLARLDTSYEAFCLAMQQ